MKKLAEKVALVALVCITFVFVLLAILYATNVIPQKEIADNAVAIVVLSVLSAMYVGLSVYLLIVAFSEALNVKRILLFYDAESTTRASHKVVANIVKGCTKEFPQLKVKKAVFRVDDKMGLIANIDVESLVAEDIAIYIPKLRSLISQSFQDALGLRFNAINFDVVKLTKKFTPTDTEVETANQAPAQEVAELPAETVPVQEDELEEVAAAEVQPSEVPQDDEPEHKQDDIADGERADAPVD